MPSSDYRARCYTQTMQIVRLYGARYNALACLDEKCIRGLFRALWGLAEGQL